MEKEFNKIDIISEPIMPPTILIQSTDFSEGWAEMIYRIYNHGVLMPTEYGNISKDACVTTSFTGNAIKQILDGDLNNADPYYSPGKKKLIEYCKQYTDEFDWKTQGFDYTYWERLSGHSGINQLDLLKAGLKMTTRRNIAITWMPNKDPQSEHPPCMQYLWLRRLPKVGSENEVAHLFVKLLRLNSVITKIENDIIKKGNSRMTKIEYDNVKDAQIKISGIIILIENYMSNYIEVHSTFRSHDAFGGTGSNSHAILNMIQNLIIDLGLKIAKYTIFDDSSHIYDNDWDAARLVIPINYHKINR